MIRNLFKRTNICSENKDILDILSEKYKNNDKNNDIIYLTREEYERYVYKLTTELSDEVGNFLFIGSHIYDKSNIYGVYDVDIIGVKIEIDPAILREEKLTQLGI